MRPAGHNRRLIWTLLVMGLVLGTAASAQEVQLSLDATGEYNSNLLGASFHERGSYTSNMGPEIRVQDPYGRFTYTGAYRGDFNWYAREPKLNGYQQYFEAEAAYAVSSRTTVSASGSFRDLSSIRFLAREEVDLSSTLDAGRDQFFRNVFGAGVEHYFNRRVSGRLDFSQESLNYKENARYTDTTYVDATGSLFYALSRQDSVGAGGGFAYQVFEGAGNRFASRGQTWNSFLNWVHRFDSDMKLSIQGGPSLVKSIGSGKIRTQTVSSPIAGVVRVGPCTTPSALVAGAWEESSCAIALDSTSHGLTSVRVLGTDPTETSLTFFGNVTLAKRWEDWNFDVSYRRQQAGASGDATISALDRIFLSANYDADQLWSFYASVGWSRREGIGRGFSIGRNPRYHVNIQSVASPAGNLAERVAVESSPGRKRIATNSQYSLILGTRRRLTKHINADLSFRYRYQTLQRSTDDGVVDATDGRTSEFFIAGFSLTYVFDPVRF